MLQPSTHQYGALRQLITVHSEDRDRTKYPQANLFEIELPVEYRNIASMRLSDVDFPCILHVFSTDNQNTKLTFNETTYTIPSGNYTPQQMADTLSTILGIRVYYNSVGNTFVFVSPDVFTLDFSKSEEYETCNLPVYGNYTHWGLGSYLGFEKMLYRSDTENFPLFPWDPSAPTTGTYIEAPFICNMKGDTCIYMEVALYNSMDELQPYSYYSNRPIEGRHGGKHNSAFAKIPLFPNNISECYTNYYFSDPPLERVQKLKFKFRYHDGRLIQLLNQDFNFTIEINYLRNELTKRMHVSNSPQFRP